jgi:group I intron endonuclease
MKFFIYKIINKNNNNEFYIGSTTKFSSRKSHHKKNVNNRCGKKYWCKLYKYIRDNGNWDNFEMLIIEEGECDNKEQMLVKEQQYIDTLKPTLNTNRAHKFVIYKETILFENL